MQIGWDSGNSKTLTDAARRDRGRWALGRTFGPLKADAVYFVIFSILFLMLVRPNFPETIYMKNGTVYPGRILSQSRTTIQFRTMQGAVVEIDKTEVQRVIYDDPEGDLARKKAEVERRKAEENSRAEEAARKKAIEKAEREALQRRTAEEKAEAQRARTRMQSEEQEARQSAQRAVAERQRAKDEEERRRQEQVRRADEVAFQKRKADMEARQKEIELRQPWQLVWRSALLPGYGQYYAGAYKKAFWSSFLFFDALVAAGYTGDRCKRSKKTYEERAGVLGGAYPFPDMQNLYDDAPALRDYRTDLNHFNGALGALAFVYIVQLFDAYHTGASISKQVDAGHSPDGQWGFWIAPGLTATAPEGAEVKAIVVYELHY